jgi:hypothetical protein
MRSFSKCLVGASLAALALTAIPVPAFADEPIVRSEDASRSAFEADRQTILSMAGDYAVVFDMQETTPWMEGYTPLEKKISGGYESVRVIEDTGTKIALQHLLVVKTDDGPYVVKHWRQDWEYEPHAILAYSGKDKWDMTPVSADDRAGAWSQTVYQVDDSPRYAGVGTWEIVNGVKRWTSNWTMRPLARRDAVRDPVYDRYRGINRHEITPTGWTHWQDNTKMMPDEAGSGELVPVVQEHVLNTYERYDGYEIAAAETYWEKTKDYWAAIRDKWDAVAAANGGIRIAQNPEVGTTIADDLLTMADAIKNGETSSDEATANAIALIADGTTQVGG